MSFGSRRTDAAVGRPWRALALATALSAVAVDAQGTTACVNLTGSQACPDFGSAGELLTGQTVERVELTIAPCVDITGYSIKFPNTTTSPPPFTDAATFDVFMNSSLDLNAGWQAYFAQTFDCNWAGMGVRYHSTAFCGLFLDTTQSECNPTASMAPLQTVCADSVKSFVESINAIFANPNICNPSPSATTVEQRSVFLHPFTQLANDLSPDPTVSCFFGEGASDNVFCGFPTSEEAMAYCATNSMTDSCCSRVVGFAGPTIQPPVQTPAKAAPAPVPTGNLAAPGSVGSSSAVAGPVATGASNAGPAPANPGAAGTSTSANASASSSSSSSGMGSTTMYAIGGVVVVVICAVIAAAIFVTKRKNARKNGVSGLGKGGKGRNSYNPGVGASSFPGSVKEDPFDSMKSTKRLIPAQQATGMGGGNVGPSRPNDAHARDLEGQYRNVQPGPGMPRKNTYESGNSGGGGAPPLQAAYPPQPYNQQSQPQLGGPQGQPYQQQMPQQQYQPQQAGMNGGYGSGNSYNQPQPAPLPMGKQNQNTAMQTGAVVGAAAAVGVKGGAAMATGTAGLWDNVEVVNNQETMEVCYNYVPTLSDEIALYVGDPVLVKCKFDDGWGFGLNLTTNKEGSFPLACLVGFVDFDADQAQFAHDNIPANDRRRSEAPSQRVGQRMSSVYGPPPGVAKGVASAAVVAAPRDMVESAYYPGAQQDHDGAGRESEYYAPTGGDYGARDSEYYGPESEYQRGGVDSYYPAQQGGDGRQPVDSYFAPTEYIEDYPEAAAPAARQLAAVAPLAKIDPYQSPHSPSPNSAATVKSTSAAVPAARKATATKAVPSPKLVPAAVADPFVDPVPAPALQQQRGAVNRHPDSFYPASEAAESEFGDEAELTADLNAPPVPAVPGKFKNAVAAGAPSTDYMGGGGRGGVDSYFPEADGYAPAGAGDAGRAPVDSYYPESEYAPNEGNRQPVDSYYPESEYDPQGARRPVDSYYPESEYDPKGAPRQPVDSYYPESEYAPQQGGGNRQPVDSYYPEEYAPQEGGGNRQPVDSYYPESEYAPQQGGGGNRQPVDSYYYPESEYDAKGGAAPRQPVDSYYPESEYAPQQEQG
ncbi:hypothetical protein HK101_000874, partial [Irineochytrium annulatum]